MTLAGSSPSPLFHRGPDFLLRRFFPDWRRRSSRSSRINSAGSRNNIRRSSDSSSVFRENPRRVLNVLLLGDALVNVPLVVLCLFFIWEGPLAARIPQWVAAIAIFAIVVLLCDLIPKLLALSAPYRLSALGVFTLKASDAAARSGRASARTRQHRDGRSPHPAPSAKAAAAER